MSFFVTKSIIVAEMKNRISSLQKYIDVFGETELITSLNKARKVQKPDSIVRVTNPIVRFMLNTTYLSGGKLYSKKTGNYPPGDYGYFKITASLLDNLKVEILSNESYRKQLRVKMLHPQQASMMTALNEIIAAGYYKDLNIKVKLYSNEDRNKADIDLVELPFASDAKLYPNNRLLLEAIVNKSAKEMKVMANTILNQGLLISVFNPHARSFQQSVSEMARQFNEDPYKGTYNDENISATIIHNDYKAYDFSIRVPNRNINFFIQASWDMAPSIDAFKISVEKAVKQAKALSKKTIPWVLVPRDANRSGIEVQMLRFAKIHQFVEENEDIYIMPVYGFEFVDGKISMIFDVFQTGQNTLGIRVETFQLFLLELYNRKDFYV